jgi:hypothetical protein
MHYSRKTSKYEQITNKNKKNVYEKLIYAQLVNNFPAFRGTGKSITVFTRAHHWSLS